MIKKALLRASTLTFNVPQDKLESYSIIDLGKTAFKWDREQRKLIPKTIEERKSEYDELEDEVESHKISKEVSAAFVFWLLATMAIAASI